MSSMPKKASKFVRMNSNGKIRVWWWSERNTRFWWFPRKAGKENFGDILTPYLTEKISGKKAVFTHLYHPLKPPTHFIIGSILANVLPHCIVWGSGILQAKEQVAQADFRAVRGPMTHKRLNELGYQVPEVYGDPALLLPRYYQPKTEKKYALGIIPHYVDYERIVHEVQDENVKIINLFDSIEKVVEDVCSCERIISSSLHGVIVPQAYQIPAIWVKLSNKLSGDDIKFSDYFLSVGIEPYKPLEFKKIPIDFKAVAPHIKEKNKYNVIQHDLENISDTLLKNCPFI